MEKRQIKFRAYYKPKLKGKNWEEAEVGMQEVVGIKWKEWMQRGYESDHFAINIKINSHDPKASHLFCTDEEVELMQYTGVDFVGKECYEGDIIENDGDRYRIVWDDDGLRWEAQGVADTHESIGLTELVINSTFIIGNIYENPELL